MVLRTRFRRFLRTLVFYALAAGIIAYFGYHAQHGSRGLNAKKRLQAELTQLETELGELRLEHKALERKVALMSADNIDPDLLDQRAREVLNYANPKDIVLPISDK